MNIVFRGTQKTESRNGRTELHRGIDLDSSAAAAGMPTQQCSSAATQISSIERPGNSPVNEVAYSSYLAHDSQLLVFSSCCTNTGSGGGVGGGVGVSETIVPHEDGRLDSII